MELKEQITYLAKIYGLSGNENGLADILVKFLLENGIYGYIDEFGNVNGEILSKKDNAKTLLLEAHMDQIGLMVSGIDDDGYIQFVNLGGVDERILSGMEVDILSDKNIYGIITPMEPKSKDGEAPQNINIDKLRIDVGMSKKDVEEQINIGNFIAMKSEINLLLNNRISGMGMDNRTGIAAILRCISKLKDKELPYNLRVLFSVQEELGLHGAYTGVKDMDIDAAIVVDVTHGTTYDSKDEVNVFDLGSGGIICRGPNLHYDYTKQLIKMVKEKNIPYQIEVASGGSGTTAWAMQVTNGGIPVMLVSIPLRYMHTNVEVLDVMDVEAVSEILYHAVLGGLDVE